MQRYLSKTEYGIDFLRHGRKIEIASRDLFQWQDGEAIEPEYPIDDPRQRGRIVGEIHLDHCRVTYTKDRFDRNDPAWEEMVRFIRGDGPLRPDKASELGYGPNDSPLFKLFQVFRRSSPKPKVAGCYAKLLIIPDNDRAEEMARHFHDADAQYQMDTKWWELVEEADRQLLVGGGPGPGTPPAPGPNDMLEGFGPPTGATSSAPTVPATPAIPPPIESPIASLSGQYRSDSTSMRWDVHAFAAEESHPSLIGGQPWNLTKRADGVDRFVVNTRHPVFASATLTLLDAMLAELSWAAMDFQRGNQGNIRFATVLAELRLRYCGVHALDPISLATEGRQVLAAVAATLSRNLTPQDATTLFGDLPTTDQEAILQKMASRSAGNPQSVIGSGRFLEFAPPRVILEFVASQPELFFDGKCWEDAYGSLDYGVPSATQQAQARVLRHYESLLADTVWIADQDTADIPDTDRSRLLRAQLAIELVAPSATEGA